MFLSEFRIWSQSGNSYTIYHGDVRIQTFDTLKQSAEWAQSGINQLLGMKDAMDAIIKEDEMSICRKCGQQQAVPGYDRCSDCRTQGINGVEIVSEAFQNPETEVLSLWVEVTLHCAVSAWAELKKQLNSKKQPCKDQEATGSNFNIFPALHFESETQKHFLTKQIVVEQRETIATLRNQLSQPQNELEIARKYINRLELEITRLEDERKGL